MGSHSPITDLSLIASVQIRARFLHYKSLLEITAADADDLERTDKSHTATLLSLSILTRTANQDLGNINAHWVEQIREGTPSCSACSHSLTIPRFSFAEWGYPDQAFHMARRATSSPQHCHHESNHQNRKLSATATQLPRLDCRLSPFHQCGLRSPDEDEDVAQETISFRIGYIATLYNICGVLSVHGKPGIHVFRYSADLTAYRFAPSLHVIF
jgi:hypothetical protein